MVDNLKGSAEEKNLALNFFWDDSLPSIVIGDSDRVSQVMYNLLGNSIKFTQRGQVHLKVTAVIQSPPQDLLQQIFFEISDTGIGIHPSYLPHLFDPFFQIDKMGTQGEQGTGLGLSISKQMINLMGGELEVRSTEFVGTTFSFTLPMRPGIKEINHTLSEDIPIDIKYDGKNVLIVEDNLTNQMVIQGLLQHFSINSELASSGREALDLLKRKKFDLIFMDLQMPGLDGMQTTRLIRVQDQVTPIIAFTASLIEANGQVCRDVGITGVLEKPVDLDGLGHCLKNFLGKPRVQDPQFTEFEVLDQLSRAIGKDDLEKVITTFLATLEDFERQLVEINQTETNVIELKGLGHKYKSSAKTLGLTSFANCCNELENLKQEAEVNRVIENCLRQVQVARKAMKVYLQTHLG